MDKWFQLRFRKGGNKRYAMVCVCMTAPLGVVLPCINGDKNSAINDAIDLVIAHLEVLRPKRKSRLDSHGK